MKIFNTIVVFDVYAVANSHEEARAAAMTFVRKEVEDGGLTTYEENALEVREAKFIRASWVGEKPLVGAEISDEDFEKLKGKTTMEVFEMIHTKKGTDK